MVASTVVSHPSWVLTKRDSVFHLAILQFKGLSITTLDSLTSISGHPKSRVKKERSGGGASRDLIVCFEDFTVDGKLEFDEGALDPVDTDRSIAWQDPIT